MECKKSEVFIRKIDPLGRIVIPVDIRQAMGLQKEDFVNITYEDQKMIIQKYQNKCIFTGSENDLMEYNGINISRKAAREIALLLKEAEADNGNS